MIPSLGRAAADPDAIRNNPKLKVMVGMGPGDLYIQPIGLVLYVLSCKEPGPGVHE